MVNFTILAGGFTGFIATYIFDSDASTLSLAKQNPTGENPSWIASHPQNSSILYAVNEISPVGSLQSFIVGSDGGLTLVDTVTSGGNGPTFTNPLSTGEVTALNFGSPNSSLVATDPADPLRFLRDSPVVDFPVNGGPSNPHMSLEHNGEVFVSDLGADKIWRLVNDGAPGKFKVQGQIDVAPGNGPRHMAIRDNILFTINEKTSTLIAQPIPLAPNGTTLPLIANVSVLPPDIEKFNGTFFAAELVISEPSDAFPDPLIYVSNRNLGPEFDERGDTIAIFQFDFKGVGGGNGTETEPSTPVSSSASPNSTATPSVDPSESGPIFATLIPSTLNTSQKKRNAGRSMVNKRMVKYHARHRRQHSSRQESGSNEPVSAFTAVAQVFTGLKQIRSFAIGKSADGGDEFLIAGANVDGGVAVFKRVDGGRGLDLVARNTELQNRTSFVFV